MLNQCKLRIIIFILYEKFKLYFVSSYSMTKINKKQFYVIAGLAGIIATASFAFPLQTAESGSNQGLCDPGFVPLLPDELCVPEELCAEFFDGFCLSLFPPPRLGECIPEHWDKIIFENEDDLLNRDGNLAAEEGSIMDIKVLDDPNRIEFPMQKAVQFLNDAQWTTDDGEPITLEDLELIDVEYAIVCVGFFDGFPNGGNTVS